MPRISSAEASVALNTSSMLYVSLHSGDPGTTGINEIAGGDYIRGAVTWSSPANNAVKNYDPVEIIVPANTTVSYIGIWSAQTAGTYYIGGPLNPAVSTSPTTPAILVIATENIVISVS